MDSTITDFVSSSKQEGGGVEPRYAWKIENPCETIIDLVSTLNLKLVLTSKIRF